MILTVTLNAAVDKLYKVKTLEPYGVMRVCEVRSTAGGKGMNVSRVAALAGEAVTAMGFVGGWNGRLFESLVVEGEIEKRFTPVQGETRSCINVWDSAVNRSTELLEPGSPVTQREQEAFVESFTAQLARADAVVLSGSLPCGVPANFYARLIRQAKSAGRPVLLDTSGEALRASLPACPDFIKPNAEELCQLLGCEVRTQAEMLRAARQLHGQGIGMVAVSRGRDGVLVVSDTGEYCGITPDVPVVNTVGCGDSMVAGFAVGLVRKMGAQEQIRYAVALSTANALTPETGSFRRADLAALLSKVHVQKLAGV